jgi:hypothetical protein
MDNLKEFGAYYLTSDEKYEDIISFWNKYKKYKQYNDYFYENFLSEAISKSEYLTMLQEKNKSIDFFIGV